jgi:hypothetical protein
MSFSVNFSKAAIKIPEMCVLENKTSPLHVTKGPWAFIESLFLSLLGERWWLLGMELRPHTCNADALVTKLQPPGWKHIF